MTNLKPLEEYQPNITPKTDITTPGQGINRPEPKWTGVMNGDLVGEFIADPTNTIFRRNRNFMNDLMSPNSR